VAGSATDAAALLTLQGQDAGSIETWQTFHRRPNSHANPCPAWRSKPWSD